MCAHDISLFSPLIYVQHYRCAQLLLLSGPKTQGPKTTEPAARAGFFGLFETKATAPSDVLCWRVICVVWRAHEKTLSMHASTEPEREVLL